jgi:hypothetical protein
MEAPLKIKLQPRDIQIMKFVFACRVVTYDQIARRHFPNTSVVIARRRIRNLAEHGYFKTGHVLIAKYVERTIQPLPPVWPQIGEKWNFHVDKPHFKSESPGHDVRMTELILRFEKLTNFRSFFTENLLQSSSALRSDPRFRDLDGIQPDGILVVKDQNGAELFYAIELEISKKTPERYREKLLGYYLARGIDGVLYICSTPQIAAVVARADREIRRDRDSIVRFLSEQDALAATEKMIFLNDEEVPVELC